MPIVPGSGFCAMMQEAYLGNSNNGKGIGPEGVRRVIKRNEAGIDRARIIAPWSDTIIPLDLTAGATVMCAQVNYDHPHADPEFVIISLGSNYPSILTAFQSPKIEEIKPAPPQPAKQEEPVFKADPAMLELSCDQVLQKAGVPKFAMDSLPYFTRSKRVTGEFIEMAFLAGRLMTLPADVRNLFRKLFGWKKR